MNYASVCGKGERVNKKFSMYSKKFSVLVQFRFFVFRAPNEYHKRRRTSTKSRRRTHHRYFLIMQEKAPTHTQLVQGNLHQEDLFEEAKQIYKRVLANLDFKASLAALQDDELGNLYETHPMYKFYQDRETEQPYRIFGVLRQSGGKVGFHAVSAHIGWINRLVGGVLAEDIELIEAWDKKQLALIALCGSPRIFLEPAGWGALVMKS